MIAAPTPTIDRPLLARDLDRLGQLIGSEIEARLASLGRSSPVIGLLLTRLPLGSPRAKTCAALASLLELDDADLAAILDLVGQQLGAWRGALDPVSADQVNATAPALRRLVEVLS